MTSKQSSEGNATDGAIKTPKAPASVGANWRETSLGKRSPRPGSYEYTTRYDFGELQRLMGAYKRTKHKANLTNKSLKDVEAMLT